jgi:hypothetical protein
LKVRPAKNCLLLPASHCDSTPFRRAPRAPPAPRCPAGIWLRQSTQLSHCSSRVNPTPSTGLRAGPSAEFIPSEARPESRRRVEGLRTRFSTWPLPASPGRGRRPVRLPDLAHYIPIPPHGQMSNGAGSCNDQSPGISQNCRWYCHCEEPFDRLRINSATKQSRLAKSGDCFAPSGRSQ